MTCKQILNAAMQTINDLKIMLEEMVIDIKVGNKVNVESLQFVIDKLDKLLTIYKEKADKIGD